MYTMDVTADTVIKGSVAVNFTASADNYTTPANPPEAPVDHDNAIADEDLSALDHDNFVGKATSKVTLAAATAAEETPIEDRDALMVSAMLVDIAPEGTTFPAFNTQGSYVPKTKVEGGAWMGGGLANYDYAELQTTDVTYKIIARGWMDLCNPTAGYDSASATNKIALKAGENHDYTLYLQPNLYTVKEGHKLALVIYTYEQGKARYTQNYQITLENSSVNAVIPVNEKAEEPVVKNPFTDVAEGSYCYDAVLWAVENGVTEGTSATTFSPDMSCTRAQMVTFLWRAAGSPEPVTTTNPFTDVNSGVYYYDAVLWAVEQGITSGTSATTFAPDATCTRAQTVTFLYRAAGFPGGQRRQLLGRLCGRLLCRRRGVGRVLRAVTVGTSDTTFSPDMNCTRAQIVTFMYRAAQ